MISGEGDISKRIDVTMTDALGMMTGNTNALMDKLSMILKQLKTKKELINRQFIYSSDTLFFKGDSMCVVHGKSINRICRYVINGVNVLLYGLDISNPSKVDTLIYSNHVLFYSFVKQTKTEPDTMRSSKSFIGPNLPVEYHYPTATMQTYAFVQANMTVTDEQIGTTFQSVYMPINFHGVTSQIGRAICDSSPQ